MRHYFTITRAVAIAAIASTMACAGSDSVTGLANNQLTAARGDGRTGTATPTTSSSMSSADRIRIIIDLSPPLGGAFGRASGKATWDSRNSNRKRELQMEAESLAPGTAVVFFVGDVQVGTGTASAFGEAKLKLSTELGQSVPTSVAGLRAEARSTTGAVIVTGVFP